ncbi:MAG: hypothetical protein ACRD5H_15360, partial [Nitrososphaerales archaeon]
GLILAIIAVNIVIAIVISFENNFVYYDLIRLAIVGGATTLSLIVFAKQVYRGLFGRAYAALAAGLILYLAAELTWSYYEIVLNEESPFPSLADAFYVAGYAGFGFHQFSLYRFYGRGIKKSAYYIVIPAVAILAYLFLQSLVSLYDLSNQEELLPVILFVTYPILDSVIFVPAILIILNSWKGQLTFIPWIFLSWVLSGSADVLFAYSLSPEYEVIFPAVTMIYNAAYLCMAAGLLWYLRFFLSGERKVLRF